MATGAGYMDLTLHDGNRDSQQKVGMAGDSRCG